MKKILSACPLFLGLLIGCNFADYAPLQPNEAITGTSIAGEKDYEPIGLVHGQSWSVGVAWVWTLNPEANLERAKRNMWEEARKHGADAVVDVNGLALRQMYLLWCVIGQHEFHVSGVAVRKKQAKK